LVRGSPELTIFFRESLDFGLQVVKLFQELYLLYFHALPEFLSSKDSALQKTEETNLLGFSFYGQGNLPWFSMGVLTFRRGFL
jgi:hypothetical protein